MKKFGYSIITVATVLSLSGVAYAQTDGQGGPMGPKPPIGPRPEMMGSTTGGMPGKPPQGMMGPRGSSTPPGMMGSTTGTKPGMGPKMGSTTMMKPGPAINGFVLTVGSDSFTLATHRPETKATTTLTVTVTASTKFANGSSTGSLTDIKAGMMVVVQGKLATSTNSVTAEVVHYGNKAMNPMQGEKKGFIQGVGNFFRGVFGPRGSTTPPEIGSTTPSAAAGGAPGFINRLWERLFGAL